MSIRPTIQQRPHQALPLVTERMRLLRMSVVMAPASHLAWSSVTRHHSSSQHFSWLLKLPVAMTANENSPQTIVMEFVVRGQSYETSPAG